ncbi:SBBP repeat-containing protein [bacterium]|nr:SBBP repeat-containing protein [bacterium]
MLKSAKFHTKNLSGLVLGSGFLSLFCLFAQASATTLSFSTFLGGSGEDSGFSLSLDGSENCYVTGYTYSTNFPTTAGAYDTSHNGGNYYDAFVTKLNSSGSSLVFSTYLGGSSDDYGSSLSVDGSGNCYVTGYTYSSNFPTTAGAYDTSHNGGDYYDAFVTKLNSSGSSLVFSTFLGGGGYEKSHSLSVDGSGNCYLTGNTGSSNFPTTAGAYDTSSGGNFDAFVTKLNSSGNSLVYSTFLGGDREDISFSLSLDGSGNCYVTGHTYSSDFPTTAGAYDTSFGGYVDAFVTKLNSSGNSLVFSTFLGGNDHDWCYSLSLDGNGNCFVTGQTISTGFPTTAGAYDTSHNDNYDAFVTKLNSSGNSLEFSTFLGGSSDEYRPSLSLDGSGNCYVTGRTYSTDFPTTAGAYDTSHNGNYDAFVTKLNSSGSSLVSSTFLGGSSGDLSYSLSVDGSGNCYVTGYTGSTNFPTTVGAYDTLLNSGNYYDAFVVKFDFFTAVTEQNNFAKEFQLNQNFPNPFNPNTTIFYTLVKANNVKLEVFNTKGKLVQTLVSEKQNEGSHSSNWNGKDENGNAVSSGVYFYKLTAGNYTQTNKMILLK